MPLGKLAMAKLCSFCAKLTRWEVVEAMGCGPNPLAQVFGIGKGGAEAHNTNGVALAHLVADRAHPGNHYLQTTIIRDQHTSTVPKIRTCR